MRKLAAVALLVAVVFGGALSSRVSAQPEPQVDETQVNARIDARLHEILGRLLRDGSQHRPADNIRQ